MRYHILFPVLSMLILATSLAANLAAQPVVSSVTPAGNDTDADPASTLGASFSTGMGSTTSSTFRVRSNMRGILPGSYNGFGTNTLTFDPNSDLLPGEEVEAVLTTGVVDTQSNPMANPYVWRFRAKPSAGPARLDQVEYSFAATGNWDVELADLDNDGDLDAVCGNYVGQNVINWNDGNGNFTSTSFGPNGTPTYAVEIADMDSDGDLDIVVGNFGHNTTLGQNMVWLNDGSGGFTQSIPFGSNTDTTMDLDVGDVDGDGDIDVVEGVGGLSNYANSIWINDGTGNLTRRGFPYYAAYPTYEVTDNTWVIRLADMENDGDLDCFVGNFGLGSSVQSYVFLNDGTGTYTGQNMINIGPLSSVLSMAVADLDGDGDADVAMGTNTNYASYIYWNDGSGFSSSSQFAPSTEDVWGLEPGDMDADGDLDLAIGDDQRQGYVLRNNGSQNFMGNFYYGTPKEHYEFAWGDVDGDGDLDLAAPHRVYVNGGNPPTINVSTTAGAVSHGGSLNVNYNDTLASLGLDIDIDDLDGNTITVSAQITNLSTQGILASEFGSSASSVPYTISPTSGTFNQGGTTHRVTLTATDVTETTTFWFDIVVGPAPNSPPTISVLANGGLVNNNGTVQALYNSAMYSLALSINVDDPDADNASLVGTVSNVGSTGILVSEFNASAQPTAYNMYPTSGTFNAPGTTHSVSLTASDGQGGVSVFSFDIVVGPTPFPLIEVYESSTSGTPIGNGANAAGGRDFGSQGTGAGATTALTIVVSNAGTADLQLGTIAIGGADASEFVLDTTTVSSTVGAGGTTSFEVSFDPNTGGTKTATVEIGHNDTTTSTPFSFEITGVGIPPAAVPVMVVRQGGSAGATLSASGVVAFGTREVGDPSAPVSIVIENVGSADLILGLPTLGGTAPGEFSLDLAGYNTVLPAGQSTAFSVTFEAVSQGAHSAQLFFTHNDPSLGSPFQFTVTGIANPAPVPGTTSSGGGSADGGGGCVATRHTTAGLLLLFLVLALAVMRRRREVA